MKEGRKGPDKDSETKDRQSEDRQTDRYLQAYKANACKNVLIPVCYIC